MDSSAMDSAAKRLEILLDGVLDDSCSDAQREELARLIDSERELSADLVEQLRLHSLLQWHAQGTKAPLTLAPVVAPGIEESPGEPPAAPSWPGVLRFSRWRWLGAAAAVVLLAVGIIRWRQTEPAIEDELAQIVDQHLVVWSDDTTAVRNEKYVVPGLLKFKSGELTLQFRSGASVSVTGEVAMRIETDMLVRLDRGQATANVPQWARGFTICTPDADIIDLGTKFGVVARERGSTDVVVFEGKVDVKPTSNSVNLQKSLVQGEGIRVNTAGAIDRIYEVRHDSGRRSWTTDEDDLGASVFKSIRDNIPSAEVPTYYQITHRGFVEDCQAYVDRHPHQWNGLTAEGFPEVLKGADYVCTRNDYRYMDYFAMTVELARPAMLYILYDDRVGAPDWLKEQFEDTGVDVGLDEGPAMPGTMHLSNAVGAGKSIDNVFSVWQRRCDRPGSIRLGAMLPQPGARAMYGIAAKPLVDAGSEGK